MFEDSFIESQAAPVPASRRWTMLGSTALQVAIAVILITIPLLHPERLTFHVDTPLVFTPPAPRPPIRVVEAQRKASITDARALPMTVSLIHTLIPHAPVATDDAPPAVGTHNLWSSANNSIGPVMRGTATGSPNISVANTEAPRRVTVSTGVSAGMLLLPIRPVYPAVAKATGISGTLVVEAVISRNGTVESLSVLSGPPLLRAAALDAIRAARYKPYLLNGQPTEVQTTFTVNFRLGA